MGNKPGSKRRRVRAHHRIRKQWIQTMEMLLDAKWHDGFFHQRKLVNGLSVYCTYDRAGNVVYHSDIDPEFTPARWVRK